MGRKEIAIIWLIFARMYGNKWTITYGEDIDPDNVWANLLAGITQDQINKGFKRVEDSGKEWPPSAPEFKKMCTELTWQERDKIIEERYGFKALPKPSNKEVGKKHIKQIIESAEKWKEKE